MNKTIWILVANASVAKIYATKRLGDDLALVHEEIHPESREKVSELLSDQAGRAYNTNGNNTFRTTYGEASSIKEAEAEQFAIRLAKMLDKSRSNNLFHELIIIISPEFLGLFNQHADKHLLETVSHHANKDYTSLDSEALNHQLMALFWDNT